MTPAQPQAGRPHPLANTTPFPNGLFELMPSLKDSEWRVLCLIVRQTWGWKEGDGRKQSDWLTQKQMMQRTGRSSEALSRAVDALVRRGLIEVRDEDGILLLTPKQRRRCGGRLYFSVANGATGHKTGGRKSEEVQIKTRPTDHIRKMNDLKSEVLASKTEEVDAKSGVRKSNTTKETGTKYLQKENGRSRKSENPSTLGVEDSRFVQDVSRFLEVYLRLIREHGHDDTSPLASSSVAEDSSTRIIYDLLQRYGFDQLTGLLMRFVRDENRKNHSLSAFQGALKSLLIAETKERLSRPREIQPRIYSGWSRAGADSDRQRHAFGQPHTLDQSHS